MYYGTDYYPEHWREERWATDARLIKEANLNMVRMVTLSWHALEPSSGVYDFDWLDRAINILLSHNIKIMLTTPTASPPKWLMDMHPDIYQKDEFGHVRGFGTRRHCCLNSKNYQEHAIEIASIMAEHFRGNPNIIAWQINNELSVHNTARCYCENCLSAFKLWLKEKYGTIDAVNRAWGTVFWSQTYNNWDELILPGYSACYDAVPELPGNLAKPKRMPVHNPGFLLDYYRFASDSVARFYRMQLDVIRKYTNRPVTHNLAEFQVDFYKMAKDLDFASWDCYCDLGFGQIPFQGISLYHSYIRGLKNRNFWVVEQQSGPIGWNTMGNTPDPGRLRLWVYQSVAHGAEAINYFRWRACLFGTEQYWYGILDHDGIPRRRYDEIRQIGNELHELSDWIVDSEVVSETAIILSHDNLWSHEIQPHNNNFNYLRLMGEYYGSLIVNNINVDIRGIDADLSSYKLVILPAFNLMNDRLKKKFEEYVSNGGNLIVTFRSGTREWDNSMTERTLPGYFKDIAGIEVEEFDSINPHKEFDPITMKQNPRRAKIKGISCKPELSTIIDDIQLYASDLLPQTGKASIWCDIIKPITAEIRAHYGSGFYKGKPAITCNKYGKGKVFYVGCDLHPMTLTKLLRGIIRESGVNQLTGQILMNIETVRKRKKDGTPYIVILNHNSSRKTVLLPKEKFRELITGKIFSGSIKLPGFGVAILTSVMSSERNM